MRTARFSVPSLALAALLVVPACTRSTPDGSRPGASNTVQREDLALSARAATLLAGEFTRNGTEARVQDATVSIEGHTLTVHVTPGQIVDEGDHTVVGIDVTVDLNGRPEEAFHVAAIGMDLNRTEAFAHAVREWLVGAGIPMVDAIRGAAAHGTAPAPIADGGTGPTAPLQLGALPVFAGPTGVRGNPPAGWERGTAEMHRALLTRIEPGLDELIPPARRRGFHSLKVMMHVRNGSGGEGDCRVDGMPNERLCQLVREFPWPAGESEFIFRQYYVLAAPAR